MSAPFAALVAGTEPRTIATLIADWQTCKRLFDRVDSGGLAGGFDSPWWDRLNAAEFDARQEVLIELARLGIDRHSLKILGDVA